MLTQVLTFTTAPDEAHAVARAALAELGPELRDLRRRLEAQLAVAVQWGAGRLEELDALVANRAGIDEPGAGARMVEAMTALHLAYGGAPAADCVALIERASADGTLLEEDEGLFTVVVLMVLTMADRPEAFDYAERMVERAHRRGSQFGMLAVSLWRGWMYLCRGELVDADGLDAHRAGRARRVARRRGRRRLRRRALRADAVRARRPRGRARDARRRGAPADVGVAGGVALVERRRVRGPAGDAAAPRRRWP